MVGTGRGFPQISHAVVRHNRHLGAGRQDAAMQSERLPQARRLVDFLGVLRGLVDLFPDDFLGDRVEVGG